MDHYQTMALFESLADELASTLANHAEWGETGARDQSTNTQYHHDVVADEVIVPRLLAEGFTVVSEESGRQGSGEVVVVVDPIDGSTNAALGLPWYATSMCAVDADGPLVGFVSNLAIGETFKAIRGEGAETSVGSIGSSGCELLSKAVVSLNALPSEHGGWSQARVYGAAALDICGVAIGRFDAYIDVISALSPWDYLAALLICEEAGVPSVEIDGGDLTTIDPTARRGPLVAATRDLLDEIVTNANTWRR